MIRFHREDTKNCLVEMLDALESARIEYFMKYMIVSY